MPWRGCSQSCSHGVAACSQALPSALSCGLDPREGRGEDGVCRGGQGRGSGCVTGFQEFADFGLKRVFSCLKGISPENNRFHSIVWVISWQLLSLLFLTILFVVSAFPAASAWYQRGWAVLEMLLLSPGSPPAGCCWVATHAIPPSALPELSRSQG